MLSWPWSIQCSLKITAGVEAVWRYLGDAGQLSLWWCPPPTVCIQFEPYVGSIYEERYRDAAYAYVVSGAVIGYEPPYRLAVKRHISGRFGTMDRIDIVLAPDGDQTAINLTHYFGELSNDLRQEAYDFFADGWSDSLGQLRQLIKNDSGDP
ncbi:SRPBCC family protein [Arthrobacter pigmenti]